MRISSLGVILLDQSLNLLLILSISLSLSLYSLSLEKRTLSLSFIIHSSLPPISLSLLFNLPIITLSILSLIFSLFLFFLAS